MPKFKFFPEDFIPDAKLMSWCKDQGLSEKQVSEQLERIMDHEFQPMRSCATRTFRRWIRNAIQWGHVVPTVTRQYRQPEVNTETAEQQQAKFESNIVQLNEMTRRVVK